MKRSYSSTGLLLTVSGQTVTNYEYTVNGDLSAVKESNGPSTTFAYDFNQLLASYSLTFNGKIQTSIQTMRHCDGRVDVTVLPLNISTSFLYGIGGDVLEENPATALPIMYNRDSLANKFVTMVGEKVVQVTSFDPQTSTFTNWDQTTKP